MSAVTPREGSSLYYSLLWVDGETRVRFLDRLTMINEISSTLDDVSDAGVAHRKIHWWHEEIERLIQGDARHPCLQAVSTSLGRRRQALKPLIDILSTTASNRFTPAETELESDTRMSAEFRGRLRLLAHALDQDDTTLGLPSDELAPLALAFGHHERLNNLPKKLNQGHSLFSHERYERHELTPLQLADGLRQGRDTALDDSRTGFVHGAVLEACNAFSLANEDLPCKRFLTQAHNEPLKILERLRAAQLALWSRRRPDLLRERTTLTPVRKWYLAWRAQREIHP